MKIDKIIKLKNNRYKIIIDGDALITFDNVLLENNLLYKKEIDVDIYNNIIKDTEYYDIYNKTVKYILKKRRSEKEIKNYLIKLNLDDINIHKIILKLKDVNLINDIEYCKAFINDKVYLSKNGINKIKMELLEQNIPIEVIEKELNNIDINIFNSRLEKMIIKKIKTNRKYSNYQLRQKILNEMINLGYNKDIIINILDTNIVSDFCIIEKEFDKLYNKLINKYEQKDVFIKLKQKLLLKGFNIEDINIVIEKKQKN